MNNKNNSQKEKGVGTVFLLDLLFVAVGIVIIIFYLSRDKGMLEWLFKR